MFASLRSIGITTNKIWAWLQSSGYAIGPKLDFIIAKLESIMSDIDRLTQDVADLKAETAKLVAEMDSNFKKLKDAIAANNSDAIKAAAAEVEATIQAMKDAETRDAPTV